MHKPISLDAETGEVVTVDQALEQARQATGLATDLAGALDEARELLIRVMAVPPDELDPPIRKEPADYAAARQMERQELEQRFALARMTARLSMRKARDLEEKIEQLEHSLATKANECDEANQVVMQLTGAAMSLHRERDELAGQHVRRQATVNALPMPREIRRIGDQSLELGFASCRMASAFEMHFTEQGVEA